MAVLKHILIALAALVVFVLVVPGNHTEAEDAFEYSRLVEEGRGAELFHPHHLLYLPMQKAVFGCANVVGYSGRSYYVARSVSMAAGAVALVLFLLVAQRLLAATGRQQGGFFAWITVFGLFSTYGFVRYACEVEIYIPAMVPMLAAVYSALRPDGSKRSLVAGIACSALALLLHTINFATALVVVPLIHALLFRRRKFAAIHLFSTTALVVLVYGVVHGTVGMSSPPVDSASEGWLQPGTPLKAVAGLGQCLVSANFAFAYEAVTATLQQWFPYRVFVEEIYTAQQMPPWMVAFAPFSFLLGVAGLLVGGIWVAAGVVKQSLFREPCFWILLIWFAGTAAPTVLLEPSNPELWILSLAPLWLLFAWLASSSWTKGFQRVAVGMVALLAFHNLLVGMGMLRNPEGDYNRQKAEWVLGRAAEGDVLYTADSFVFSFYLNYWSEAEVRNANSQGWKQGKSTFVFDDVFNPPPAVGIRYPGFAKHVEAVAKELRPICSKVRQDRFGGVWMLDGKGGKQHAPKPSNVTGDDERNKTS